MEILSNLPKMAQLTSGGGERAEPWRRDSWAQACNNTPCFPGVQTTSLTLEILLVLFQRESEVYRRDGEAKSCWNKATPNLALVFEVTVILSSSPYPGFEMVCHEPPVPLTRKWARSLFTQSLIEENNVQGWVLGGFHLPDSLVIFIVMFVH